MSEPIGRIINTATENTSREPATQPIDGGVDPSPGGSDKPEVLYGFDAFEPTTERIRTDASADSGSGEPKRTKSGRIDRRTLRGRAGTGSGEAAKVQDSLSIDKVSLTDLLMSIHVMGATFLSTPELELDEGEAEKLSEAIQKVGKHYVIAFDPKKVAICELAVCMGAIYGTRFVAWKKRVEVENQQSPKPAASGPTTPTPIRQVKQEPQPDKVAYRSPSEMWEQDGLSDGIRY